MESVGKYIATPIVYHGSGACAKLADEIHSLGVSRVGVITDAGIVKSGIYDQVARGLPAQLFCYADVPPEPPLETVSRCTDFLRQNRCELVIGLGGGSAIDAAKMAAVMMGNSGSVVEFLGLNKVPKPGMLFVAVPTTAGTGSEVTPAAVFVDARDQTKKGVRSDWLLPRLAILDPLLTLTLPPPLTASTGVDALTHAIEGYTSKQGTLLSELTAERAVELIGANLKTAYMDGTQLAARSGMLMGSYLGGITLSIANVGAVHSLAQTIGAKYRISHGTANALLLPYVMEFNRPACEAKYARIASLIGEKVEDLSDREGAQKAVEAVRRLTRELQIPQKLREIQVPEDALETIADRCLETQARLLVLNPRTTERNDLIGILRQAY